MAYSKADGWVSNASSDAIHGAEVDTILCLSWFSVESLEFSVERKGICE
jgi:hypothetical protein